MKHKFPYKWSKRDGYPSQNVSRHDATVFGTFICGGGSTMGYKLAGFNHLGGVEIDASLAKMYAVNHQPQYLFTEDIRKFRLRSDLPEALFKLDILDGSPPCSSFSTAGNRDKDWGKTKVFREGQTAQRLDDLFFEFIALAAKLRPKVVVAENVKGLVKGSAKAYVHKIAQEFKKSGYNPRLFVLNAASMGVPQKRERCFFIAHRQDLKLPQLQLNFTEPPITYGEIRQIGSIDRPLNSYEANIWGNRLPTEVDFGQVNLRLKGKSSNFNSKFISDTQVVNTITATTGSKLIAVSEKKHLTQKELMLAGTFPLDYDFAGNNVQYVIGMSVPPVMMAQIAHQIKMQWLK